MKHFQVMIIGGGTGGIMVASQLKRRNKGLSIGLIEPSEFHYYQPAWTLVGAGTYDFKDTRRKQADYIPQGVEWIQDKAGAIDPENNTVSTASSGAFTYEYLVVAPGLTIDLSLLPGLEEAMQTSSVGSVYTDPDKVWRMLRGFKEGNAIFTQANTPIKCGGAPQKVMYLAEDYFRKQGVRDQINVVFATPGSVIFGVKEIAKTLSKIVIDRDIALKTFYAPIKVDAPKREITFRFMNSHLQNCAMVIDKGLGEEMVGETDIKIKYDMLHLAPPQRAPDFIRDSSLSIQEGANQGWMEVDIHSLQHKQYPNVFGLGDVAALPTAKTGAAIRKQAPVVVDNILEMIQSKSIGTKKYEGYSSCPLVTRYGRMVLAEFKYNNVRDSDPLLSKLMDTTKEQYSMWLLKKYGLPFLYWNMMLRGRM
ncbi:NAD(P)/FAD-dependent oxidoreductase [Pleomorphovibrio marinus]|uniref:NAD(P)/FAD-dependent oxidoreductase n=1 Tax=Pleomorphovibrio marinus TaxID=2164132 RepID=UPI000E0C225C|nr:FAD/NAD(P)-binding oxidoreductase [Pleomorphovibrio marinus]